MASGSLAQNRSLWDISAFGPKVFPSSAGNYPKDHPLGSWRVQNPFLADLGSPNFKAPSLYSLIKAERTLRERHVLEMLSGVALAVPIGQKLISLQAAIYGIDQYGEQNWEIMPSDLELRWNSIVHCFENCATLQFHSYALVDVRKYLEIELSMRSGTAISNEEIGSFYYLKCCDIRLMRSIVSSWAFPNTRGLGSAQAWGLLDVVAEVQDDFDDLAEDQRSYNGNRLLHCLRGNSPLVGLEEYSRFLSEQAEIAARGVGSAGTGSSDLDMAIYAEAERMALKLLHRIPLFKHQIDTSDAISKRTWRERPRTDSI